MRRRKAQKKRKRKKWTVCLRCPLQTFDPVERTKPSSMRAELVQSKPGVWVVVKTCLDCGHEEILY